MIVLFGGEKGGVGKTTLAINIATLRTSVNNDLLLIDTDKQATSSYWCSVREEKNICPRIASVQKYEKSLRNEVVELSKKFSDIIIDAGGRDSVELRCSLLVANKAIFPLRPSQFDLWTLSRLSSLVESAQEVNDSLRAFVVVNQASSNPAVKEAEEMKKFVDDFKNIGLLQTIICERIAFRRAALNGMSVVEYKEDQKSAAEIKNLYAEIYG